MYTASEIIKQTAGRKYTVRRDCDEWKSFAKQQYALHGYACTLCKRGNTQLNVHHWAYDSNRDPWDYRDDEVTVLCRDCHQTLHEHLNSFRIYVFSQMSVSGFRILNGSLAAGFKAYGADKTILAIKGLVCNPRSVELFSKEGMDAK